MKEEIIRQPIIAVLGHVDHGKTSTLDAIRDTRVHTKEHGMITQHIGASEVPQSVILELGKGQFERFKFSIKVPGLLFIDTPGHAAFTHLRERGSSIADFAVLVIDVNQGIQPQTIESIKILKQYKTPFVVAANKIDALPGWIKQNTKSFLESYEEQNPRAKEALDQKIYNIIGKLGEHGFSSDRFDRINDFTKELAIVPVSAKSREGISELLLFITAICQRFIEKDLEINPDTNAKGTILEIVEIKGLGSTMNILIYDGTLKRGDTILFAGKNGVIRTKVRALMKPKPLTEIRQASKSSYDNIDNVVAAAGIKILANDCEQAIAGSPVIAAKDEQECIAAEEELKKEVSQIIIKSDHGVVVKADTLGSLQALIRMLEEKGIAVARAYMGELTKEDIAIASSMAKLNPEYAAVLVFHVEVSDEEKLEAASQGVTVINSMIIYEAVDRYVEWKDKGMQMEKSMFREKTNLPCKIKVLKNCCFRINKPCIFGGEVLAGTLRAGDEVMDPSGKIIGKIKGIQKDRKSEDSAAKGEQVAISIEGASFGKEICYDGLLYSFFYKEPFLDAVKNWSYFTTEEKEILIEIGKILNLSHYLEGKS